MSDERTSRAPEKDAPVDTSRELRYLLRLLARERLPFAMLMGAMAVQVAYNLIFPRYTKALLDTAIPHEDVALVGRIGAVLGVAWLLRAVATGVQASATGRAASSASRHLGAEVHARALASGPNVDARTLEGYATTDTPAIHAALAGPLPGLVYQLLNIGACTALMLTLHIELTIVTLFVLIVAMLAPRTFGARGAAATQRYRGASERLGSFLREDIGLRRWIRQLDLFEWRAEDRALMEAEVEREGRRAASLGSAAMGGTATGAAGVRLVLVVVGSLLAATGRLSLGELVAILALINAITGSAMGLSALLPMLLSSTVHAQRVRTFLAAPQSESPNGPQPMPAMREGIRAEAVYFAHEPGPWTIRNVSLHIEAGSSVAFVGPSGSGKSTMLGLLLGELVPERGVVRYGAIDRRSIDDRSFHAHLARVDQQPRLFDVSIGQNVRAGRLDANEDQVHDAIVAAGLGPTVQGLAGALSAPVGPGGENLSGGQRQRVAVARALLRDAPLLVLDEATSALDPKTEAEVVQALVSRRGRSTILSVTHRLSTCVHCDQIFVLDRGAIAERGTHAELLTAGGIYATMWTMQSGIEMRGEEQARIHGAALSALPLFEGVPAPVLDAIAARFVSIPVEAGRDVYRRGDVADAFYLVAHGQLETLVGRNPDAPDARGSLRMGEGFGEMAILDGAPRRVTARATRDSVVLALHVAAFRSLCESSPELLERLRASAERHRMLADQSRSVLGTPMPGRYLQTIAYGRPSQP